MSALAKHSVSLGQATNKGTIYPSVNAKADRIGAVIVANIATPASASAVTGTTITAAGTGFTNPANVICTPNAGTAKVICTALKGVSATLGAAGTGYAANDTITLANGVIITVDTVSSGAVATFHVSTAGSVTGQIPANPTAQVSTSGAGTGATFNVAYGLLTMSIVDSGNGSNPTWTVTSSDAGTGATMTSSQGGNGNAIFVQVACSDIPAVCVATFDTNFACNGWVSLKRNGYVTFALQPIGATTLAAGSMDAIILS